MEQSTTLSSRRSLAISVAELLVLLLATVLAPLIGNQYVTGTIVNASLLMSVMLLGFNATLLLCFLPSIISLSTGLLPGVLAPMVPFIILGNIVLAYTFSALRNRNFWVGLFPAALLKFSLLFFASNFIIDFFIKGQVAKNIAVMMSWPQLITALAGGAVAFVLYKALSLDRK